MLPTNRPHWSAAGTWCHPITHTGSVPASQHLGLFSHYFCPEISGFHCKAPNFPLRFPVCNNISNPPLLRDSQRLQEEGGL